MDPFLEHEATLTRRHFFSKAASGIGVAALWSMMAQDVASSAIERLLDDGASFCAEGQAGDLSLSEWGAVARGFVRL